VRHLAFMLSSMVCDFIFCSHSYNFRDLNRSQH
jgi:hypothetical protein